MYPKVFTDYMEPPRHYGPVRTLPTRTFFYGMEPGEEIEAEIDPGKTLEVRLQAVGETTEDGEVRVFFELNGQPRTDPRAQPQGRRPNRPAAQGRGRQPEPCRRADARRRGHGRGQAGRRSSRATCC
jgi:pyruvate carboxylase